MSSDEKSLWIFARAASAVEGASRALTPLTERLGLATPGLSSSNAIVAAPWELIRLQTADTAEAFAPHLCDAACVIAEKLGGAVVVLFVDQANDAARICRCVPAGPERQWPKTYSGRRRSVVEEASLYVGIDAPVLWPLLGRSDEPYPGETPPASEEERFIDEKLREARTQMRRYLESKDAAGQGKGR